MTVISSGTWPIDPTATSGTELAAYLNELVNAIQSTQASASRPPAMQKGGVWAKTLGATDIALMFFDGAADHEIGAVRGGAVSFGGVAASATAPTSPATGDTWVDISAAGGPVLKIWNGTAWVGSGAPTTATPPATPKNGDTWVDLTTPANPVFKIWNGTAWVGAGSAAGGGDRYWADNEKAVFGDGSDLQIYHDGANSIIKDAGTGNIIIGADTFTYIGDPSASNTAARFNAGGAQAFYHNNVEKLATTATGVDVMGNLTVEDSGLTTAKISSTGDHSTDLIFDTDRANADSALGRIWHKWNGHNIALIEAKTVGDTTAKNSGYLRFHTSNAGNLQPRMDIDKDGNVGIGTDTPNRSLHVLSGAAEQATFASSGATAGINFQPSGSSVDHNRILVTGGEMLFVNSNEEHMRIDTSGNVGIGTKAPASTLEVHNNSSSANSFVNASQCARFFQEDNSNPASIKFQSADNSNGGQITWGGVVGDGPFMFKSYNVERMRIDKDGNVGIGTPSNTLTNSRSAFYVGSSAGKWLLNHSTGNNTGDAWIDFGYKGVKIGSITQSGNTSTAYNTSSDYRLKEDIKPVADAAKRLMDLKPVNFAWKVDGTRVDGFLAHEVGEVVPGAAHGVKDAMRDEEYEVTPAVYEDVTIFDGEDDELEVGRTEQRLVTPAVMGTRSVPDYQGIDQSKIVPLLTAALQEALGRIEALEAAAAKPDTKIRK